MTRDDIIRMAREAGSIDSEDVIETVYEAFTAAERERIKAANAPEIEAINAHIKALEDAVAAEREACAKLEIEMALSPAHFVTMAEWRAYREGVEEYAAAIRARGNQ